MPQVSVDDYLKKIYEKAMAEFNTTAPYDLWLVDGAFVAEPWLGGLMLGQFPNYDLTGKKVLRLTQQEFDDLMNAFQNENGYFPET